MTDTGIGKTILREVCDQCGKPIFPANGNTSTARLTKPGFCNCSGEPEDKSKNPDALNAAAHSPAAHTRAHSPTAPSAATGFDATAAIPELEALGFTLMERLGKGALGYVYQARASHGEAFFAVKIFDRDLFANKRTFKRLEQEIQRSKEISHPHIATVYEFGTAKSGYPYLVMDFLAGPSLAEVIAGEGFLEVQRVVDMAIQVCEALQHAHEKGLLHRALKPSNIYLLPATSGGDYVKLSDLGVARALPNPGRETRYMTPEGEEFGNPSYMSPEQCLGTRLTPSSDLYSLGCVLYESLSGKLPLASSNPVRLAFKQVSEDPKNLQERFNDLEIPEALSDIVMTLLQKNVANRFASANDLREALIAFRDGKIKPAKPKQKSQGSAIQSRKPDNKLKSFFKRLGASFKKPPGN